MVAVGFRVRTEGRWWLGAGIDLELVEGIDLGLVEGTTPALAKPRVQFSQGAVHLHRREGLAVPRPPRLRSEPAGIRLDPVEGRTAPAAHLHTHHRTEVEW